MNFTFLRVRFSWALGALLWVMASALRADQTAPPAAETPVLAWLRFSDSPQSYAGQPYVFLGDSGLELRLAVPPRLGHRLELLWGAKGDTRGAWLAVNGQSVKLSHGGYDGFQWLTVPLPAGLGGAEYQILLQPPQPGTPAFLAAVRLCGPATETIPSVATNAAAQRITARRTPRRLGEAFPAMRPFWDREPTPPTTPPADPRWEARFRQAEQNGRHAAEAFYRCRRFVDGWLAHADPVSGLIPRNLGQDRDLWNGRDAAADNYPFMVLTCALTDRPLFEGRMREMLRAEIRLTSRVDRLGDHYSFSRRGFMRDTVNLDTIIFDNAEYVKDGLIPVTEWLGPSPWSERMVGLVEDIWKHAPVDTPFGRIPTLNFEVNGDLLQAGARLYWFTGRREFLEWAMRLGDYYLLGRQHPTRDLEQLRLSDHGCEVLNGLSELYVAVTHAAPEKRAAYQAPLQALFDRVLEIGRDPRGLLYSWINPKTGAHSPGLCDTWGYNYDGFYTLFLLDQKTAYRDAVRQALSQLRDHYVGAPWDDKSADGYADSIEGAINLMNREPMASAAEWVDSQIRLMWSMQQPDGVIEGWHGDGNGARTSLMYALWKTQGAHLEPWRADVRLGAVREGSTLCLSLAAEEPWTGVLRFDQPRHRLFLHLPLDYPRINQFPEWFTVEPDRSYAVERWPAGTSEVRTGRALADGLTIELPAGREIRLRVRLQE